MVSGGGSGISGVSGVVGSGINLGGGGPSVAVDGPEPSLLGSVDTVRKKTQSYKFRFNREKSTRCSKR